MNNKTKPKHISNTVLKQILKACQTRPYDVYIHAEFLIMILRELIEHRKTTRTKKARNKK